ncbi:hypothetical protein [Cyclobacterium qasimii]|uniref:Uncharacterized protein n=1 Tax=Cyclobacterium qasimii TaxID=1350429 RepID=A0A512C6Y1_9BACT|nr:hypothetical protein [Cyclobacterium qasimii]GEO19974.1 hypothetical protein CQA01_05080 [Cyclobacterium qasimii]
MKYLKIASLTIIGFLFFITSCNKDEEIKDQQPKIELETVDIKVILPEGLNFDLSKTKLISLSEEFSVSNSGDTEAILNAGSRGLIVLKSQNDTPLLMSFISDTNREISVKTTLEAAMFYGLGTVFLPEEVREQYFEQSDELIGSEEILSKANAIFTSNISALTTNTFVSFLQEEIDKIRNNGTDVAINKRTIEIFQNNVKSGLQVEEVDFETIRISNNYRRRAHAFVYKTGYKDETGKEFSLISNIPEQNPSPYKDEKVPPTGSVREFFGLIQDWAAGEGTSKVKVESSPMKLDLEENHLENIYSTRIIGVSATPNKLTELEKEKLHELEWQTLGLDFVLPLMLDLVGHAELLKGLDETAYEPFVNGLILFGSSISSTSSVTNLISEGKYSDAAIELIYGLVNNSTSGGVEDVLKLFIDGTLIAAEKQGKTTSIAQDDRIMELVKNFGIIMETTDIFLKAADYARISSSIFNASMVEEWKVSAKRTPVTLVPEEAIAFPFILKPLEAIIKDTELSAGQIFEYKWSTTGNFGTLKDDDGREGTSISTTATSSPGNINYLSNVDDDDLPDGAEDKVMVEVIIKGPGDDIIVGKDTAIVKIRPFKYEIKPQGVKISGGMNLALSITKPDGSENITNNELNDYRIIWSTSGSYGLLGGTESNMTRYNDNKMVYNCLDKDVEDAEEKVFAKIYSKRKDQGDDAYSLLDEIETTIKIDNDENTIEFKVSGSGWIYDQWPEAGGLRTLLRGGFQIPYYKDAISYEIEILDYGWVDEVYSIGNTHIGDTYTWTNDTQRTPIVPVFPDQPITEGFSAQFSSASINSIGNNFDENVNRYLSIYGTAIVRITLDN